MNETSEFGCVVYLIQAGDGPIKIGISSNPEKRLLDLQTAHYEQLKLIFTFEYPTTFNAFRVERALHKSFKDFHIRGEWYRVNPETVITVIEQGVDTPNIDERKTTVRVLESFYHELIQSAQADTRSLNAQILVLLREALAARKPDES